jgi:hypothetical protein
MTRSVSISALRSEFSVFLYAPIGDDRNDMPVSVLSALARLDIDPWQEAAELARLPRAIAAQRLSASIAALSDGTAAHPEHGTIAARLIALLPCQTDSEISPRKTPVDLGDVIKFRAGIYMSVVLIAVTLAAQWIAADRQTPDQFDGADPSASSATAPPQMSPPDSGQ